MARVRVRVREARVRAREVGVVVARIPRLPRRPRVPPRQRPALAHHYVVVASMSLRIPIIKRESNYWCTPSNATHISI